MSSNYHLQLFNGINYLFSQKHKHLLCSILTLYITAYCKVMLFDPKHSWAGHLTLEFQIILWYE